MGGNSTTINANFYSPAVMNQYDQLQALKNLEQDIAFEGAIA
jgi:hypothetical protein